MQKILQVCLVDYGIKTRYNQGAYEKKANECCPDCFGQAEGKPINFAGGKTPQRKDAEAHA